MTVKFITVKGPDRLARAPFYLGIPQHERTMSRREAYEHVALKTGYTPTAVRAVFMAAAEYVRENQRMGNITFIDGVASIRNYVRGSFEGLAGPWVKGRATKDDEYVALANARGAETKAEITFSDLQNVKARLAAALEPGEYTLKVYTRSGLGDQYGVHVASRKVQVA